MIPNFTFWRTAIWTADHNPVALDARIVLAAPNYEESPTELDKLFSVANPQVSNTNGRIMVITLEQIYRDQAQVQVRAAWRRRLATYPDFDAVFRAQDELNRAFLDDAINALAKAEVPIRVLEVQISNIKPDPGVIEAQIKVQAAQAQIDALQKLGGYLRENPDMRELYKLQVLQELVRTAAADGKQLIVVMDTGAGSGVPTALDAAALERLARQFTHPPEEASTE